MPTPTSPDVLDDEITPSVLLTLGKKEYRLAFPMGAVLAFKAKTGRNIFTVEGWNNFSLHDDPEAILAFFWAALQTYQPEITYEKAGRLANFGNMKLITDKCEEALRVFMPKPEAEADPTPEPTTEARSIGSSIGQ
jgi:hypothetical protein